MDKTTNLRQQIFNYEYAKWVESMLFSPKWWILLIIVLSFWITWWKLVDKNRLAEIGAGLFLTMTLSTVLNSIGIELTLWRYPDQLFGSIRFINVLDLTLIPITYMFLYQFFGKWKSYLLAITLFALIGSFVGQPIFSYFNLYELINWEYIYSFPIYLFIGIIIKFLLGIIMGIQNRNKALKSE
ncbi:CBO0543 family protein [Bacillus sp. CHD6a]|uniref:CBO0543 family protein n=1 Tax=Bacillus sp. CHD6a TaxID=1643452 RepID=UPI0006CE1243|nr:CBO0543 family protein [Bacillus sp. CHD6a]KPB06172.1 hypothetical protein AAV98_04510 [Bacillus sp. CHD6a]